MGDMGHQFFVQELGKLKVGPYVGSISWVHALEELLTEVPPTNGHQREELLVRCCSIGCEGLLWGGRLWCGGADVVLVGCKLAFPGCEKLVWGDWGQPPASRLLIPHHKEVFGCPPEGGGGRHGSSWQGVRDL